MSERGKVSTKAGTLRWTTMLREERIHTHVLCTGIYSTCGFTTGKVTEPGRLYVTIVTISRDHGLSSKGNAMVHSSRTVKLR